MWFAGIGPTRSVLRQVFTWILLAAVYVIAGKLGLALAFVNASATAVWPPTGIALAAVLMFGPGVWPGILVGAFLTNDTTAGSLATSLLIASGNTLEALVGGYLVNRFADGRGAFDSGRNILLFVLLAGLLSTTISATVGVTTLSLYGFADWSAYASTWLTWWLGDASGALVVAPALLFWTAQPRSDWSPAQCLELLVLFLVLLIVGSIVFLIGHHPVGFLCIPVCVWAGWRFGQREAATVTCVLSTMAIWGSVHGLGTFGKESPNDALLLLQAFMAMTTIIGITVGAAVSGRRVAESRLRQANGELESRVRARTTDLQTALDELRASQTRLEDAQHVAHIGSWDWKVSEDEVWWSRELYRIYGVDPERFQASYEAFVNTVHPEDRERVADLVRRPLEDRQPFECEHRIIRADGDVRTILSRGRTVLDQHGQVHRMLGTGQDITERKRLEEHLQHAQKMDAIGRLAGGIAHDFNNMLTAISGYSELTLAQIGDDKPISADLLEIRKAAESAAALTRQLLTFSRRQTIRLVATDLNAVIVNVGRLLRHTLGEDIRIATNLSPDLRMMQADATQLQQVIMNLAVNARDAMPTGGALVIETTNVDLTDASASTDASVAPGRCIRLTVSDTGCGMNAATKERLFEPFFTTKEPNHGTGLGLATVYGIVHQLGGTIWVYSEVGRGTTFKLYFPETRESPVREPQKPPVRQHDLLGREAVMVVEDDQGVCEFAVRVLRRYGYRVREASSAGDALALLERVNEPIDLLITDLIMPDMTGCELADRFRAVQSGARLLYISGYTEEMIVKHGLSVGVEHVLQKPFTSTELLQKVREVLDAHSGMSKYSARRHSSTS